MSRPEDRAFARMFRCDSSPAARHDGRDLVLEAMDDAGIRKQIAQHMRHAALEGFDGDDAELGRMLREYLTQYAGSCPRYEDYLSEERADMAEGSVA